MFRLVYQSRTSKRQAKSQGAADRRPRFRANRKKTVHRNLMLRRHAVHSGRHLHFLIVSRNLKQTGGLRAFFYVL